MLWKPSRGKKSFHLGLLKHLSWGLGLEFVVRITSRAEESLGCGWRRGRSPWPEQKWEPSVLRVSGPPGNVWGH